MEMRTVRIVARLVLGAVAVSGAILAQTPAPLARDGVIAGQVVDATTGRPVSAAIVSISGSSIVVPLGPSGSVHSGILTGADGRFLFRDLAHGAFTITVTKGGYAEGASGRRRPAGAPQPVALTDAQPSADVRVRVWRNGVIGGTVTDEAGEPVVGVQVRVLLRTSIGGRRWFAPSIVPSFTDDRGMYRFSNLLPGEYLVIASGASDAASGSIAVGRGLAGPPAKDGRPQVYPPTFHPATPVAAEAVVVALSAGEERATVDVHLQPVATAKVSGTLITASAPGMVPLRLLPSGAEEVPADILASMTYSDAGGAFTFPAVPVGQYVLRGATRMNSTEVVWIDVPIGVTGNIEGLAGVLHPGLTIRGHLEFEGAAPRPEGNAARAPITLEAAGLRLLPVPPSSVSWIAAPGGSPASPESFLLRGIAGGAYFVRVTGSPPGWMFKSATIEGRDVSEAPFQLSRDVIDLTVTFTDRSSAIDGAVLGANAADALVLVFPTDAQKWTDYGSDPRRLRSARASAAGKFGLGAVPAGDYYIIAVPEEQAVDWRDPKMLELLARAATRVTVLEGEHKTIDLRMQEAK
jgi:Carboxypeptidase regulatory-like domain